MAYQDHLENHYPLPVLQRRFSDMEDLNGQLFALIADLESRHRDGPENAVHSGEVSTQGGYQTSTKMNLFTLDHPAIAQFRDRHLMPAIGDYLKNVFEDEAERLTPWPVGWANLLDAGDWQGPHCHPTTDNLASGVYYVRLPGERPNPEGRIEFINPMPASLYHGYSQSRRLHPEEGLMVLFPPYYMHYVHPFQGEDRRAVIAFDVLARRPGLNLAF